jgi:hypothetical protein
MMSGYGYPMTSLVATTKAWITDTKSLQSIRTDPCVYFNIGVGQQADA